MPSLTGANSLAICAGGTVILTSNNNTYSGTTTVNSGTLQIGDGATSAGSLPGNVVIAASGTLAFDPPAATSFAWSGNISGTGSLAKIGSGQAILSGTNTYGGATLVSGGVLEATTTAALAGFPTFSNNTVAVSSGAILAVQANTADAPNGWRSTDINTLVSNGNVSFCAEFVAGHRRRCRRHIHGQYRLQPRLGRRSEQVGWRRDDHHRLQYLHGSNDDLRRDAAVRRRRGLQRLGGGQHREQHHAGLRQSVCPNLRRGDQRRRRRDDQRAGPAGVSGSNVYTGGTTVSAGTLQFGSNSALSGSGGLSVSPGAVVDVNGFSPVVGGALSGGGLIDNLTAGGSPILTVGNGNGSGTFSGVMQSTTGTLGFIKAGTGLQALAGTNTFNYGAEVNGGTLQFQGNSNTMVVAVSQSATYIPNYPNPALQNNLCVGVSTTGTLVIQDSASVTVASYVFLGHGSGVPGNVIQTGGTLAINGYSGHNANMALTIGEFPNETSTYTLSGGLLSAPNGLTYLPWNGTGVMNITGGSASLKEISFGAGAGGGGTLNLSGSGALYLGSGGLVSSPPQPYAISLGGGTLGAYANWTSALNMSVSGATTINTAGYTIGLSGSLSGGGGLTKVGANTLTLSGSANTYGGGTTIERRDIGVRGNRRDAQFGDGDGRSLRHLGGERRRQRAVYQCPLGRRLGGWPAGWRRRPGRRCRLGFVGLCAWPRYDQCRGELHLFRRDRRRPGPEQARPRRWSLTAATPTAAEPRSPPGR